MTNDLIVPSREEYEAVLVAAYGPRPINIFTRLRYSLDLSHAELASRMYTTKLSLIRLEQGCFEKPLDAAMKWWLNWSDLNDGGLSDGALTHQYEEFQDQMRRRHKRFFGSLSTEPASTTHPLQQLRLRAYGGSGCSITEIAKALCLNQATLQHWEKKWRAQQSVPKSFQVALMATKYSKYEVKAFNESYHEWRANNK